MLKYRYKKLLNFLNKNKGKRGERCYLKDNNLKIMYHKKTSLGMDENVEAILAYAGIWVTGLIFLFIEKENTHVRFHAMQSLITFFSLFIVSSLVLVIPVLGILISSLITFVGTVLWLLLMYKAYNGEVFKLPYVGDLAEELTFGESFEEDNNK